MDVFSAPPAPASSPLPQLLAQVLAGAGDLIEQVIEAARLSLRNREDQARTAGEHQALHEARQQLVRLGRIMTERYPEALRSSLSAHHGRGPSSGPRPAARTLSSIHFDDLELMDETQVSESVERARAQQILAASVEGPLADLDGLVCAALGLHTVDTAHNPLRPEVFLQALQQVLTPMQATPAVRHEWIGHMAPALGVQLRQLYLQLIGQLRQSGVQPVGFAMRQAGGDYAYITPSSSSSSSSGSSSPGFDAAPTEATPQTEASLLTLERLRSLLLGELTPAPHNTTPTAPTAPTAGGDFAARFAREFEAPGALPSLEPPSTDFAITVPAAFEALQEMKQVDHMVTRLAQQRAQGPNRSTDYAALRQQPGGLGQALGMEVVALMLENIARDDRLLPPVQQFVRTLEPALLQLAIIDPRFFSQKDHPARRLLQDITERSLAFAHPQSPGFDAFMQTLLDTAGPLVSATIDSQAPFAQVLAQLQAIWARQEEASTRERTRAIAALEHAEQRHLLAVDISREIWLLPQIDKVPGEIASFLLGPWVQVIAQARLENHDSTAGSSSNDPGRYRETVDALLWSAQPELTRANASQLARLVPKLLAKLREGLACIDYPANETRAFFDCLMQLHQEAFRPSNAEPTAPAAPATQAISPPAAAPTPAAPPPKPRPALELNDDLWVAPAEAKDSGFMDAALIEDSAPLPLPSSPAPLLAPEPTLALGTWINLLVQGQWERMQLSWIGPHDTLFLFTSASGRTQSMTLRLLNRLREQGALHILAPHKVVDGALDAITQTAIRNSVDSTL